MTKLASLTEKYIVYFVVVVGRSYPKLNLSRGLCEWIFARILRARIERTTYNATSQSRCSTNCNTNVYYPHFSLSNTFSLDSVLTAIPIRIMLQVYYISHWKGLEKKTFGLLSHLLNQNSVLKSISGLKPSGPDRILAINCQKLKLTPRISTPSFSILFWVIYVIWSGRDWVLAHC